MEKLKIRVHPTFIIFVVALMYFNKGVLLLNYLVVLLLHELAHAFVAKKLGYNIQNIKIIPFGICLNLNSSDLLPEDEIKIAIAGPLLNFVLCILILSLWWLFPFFYNYTYFFFYANLVTGLFNLLPAFPLDGGRVFRGFLKKFFSEKMSIKICKVVSVLLILFLLTFFVISLFYSPNFTYILVVFCILSGILETNFSYSLAKFSSKKKQKKTLKIRSYFICDSEKILKMFQLINSFSFCFFYVYAQNGELLQVLDENELFSLVENISPLQPIKNALNLK